LTNTPTIGALFPTGTAFALGSTLAGLAAAALTETAFATAAGAAFFVPDEIGLAFGLATADFPEADTEAVFVLDTVGLTEAAFWAEVADFTAAGFTETAVIFGAVLVPLALVPFGEGFPACAIWVVAGTLTVAGAAGFCTAVGVCANAAADRSMSVPRVRII
jgi:hypothetical protein